MKFPRALARRITDLAAIFPAVVLTGARQVGKTTLLTELFPSHRVVTLDLPTVAEMAEREPELFLRENPPPILIDEVQYAPKLFRHLKVEIDRSRDTAGRFILTGSQKFTLMKEVSDSLAGRVGIAELEGLSCEELKDGDVYPSATEIIARGGFPELWKTPTIPAHEFYRSYLSTYLERDVRQITNVTSLRDFERFIRACAARSGQILNKTDLGRDVGITQKTVNEWLSVLSASNQITLLEPYFGNNIGKRLVKSPKLFLNDTGLLTFLLGLRPEALPDYSGIGALWETFVFSELRKIREAHRIESTLWFYGDSHPREIDFVIDAGGALDLIEAKWTELPDTRDTANLNAVAADLDKPVRNKLVACRASTSFPLPDGCRAVRGLALHERR